MFLRQLQDKPDGCWRGWQLQTISITIVIERGGAREGRNQHIKHQIAYYHEQSLY